MPAPKQVIVMLSFLLILAPAVHGAPPPAATSSASPSNPEAAALILSALTSIESKDLDTAAKQLEAARTLNPDQEFYWATFGKLMLRRGQNAEALAAYRKELALHPDETPIYRSIVDAQFALHQRQDAMQSLHQWAVAEPAEPLPAAKLVMLLVEDRDFTAATREGEAALARLPQDRRTDDRLQIELGRAQILAGDKAKGSAAVRAVLARSGNPAMIDNAAWVLADANLDLPTAKTAVQAILALYSLDSNAWTLAGNFKSMRGKTANIASAWETYGWILFREGKLDQAESYANAAWLILQSPETAEHLAAIEAARDNKPAALTEYGFALAVPQPDDNLGERKALAPHAADITLRVEALRKAGATSSASTPEQQLQAINTIALGPHDGRNQNVNYRLLLKDGHVESAEPIQSNRNIEGALDMLSRADFTRYTAAGAHMQLVRTGQLTCRAGSCQVVVGP